MTKPIQFWMRVGVGGLVLIAGAATFVVSGNPQTSCYIYILQRRIYGMDPLVPSHYTGTWRKWSTDGQQLSQSEYQDGLQDGAYIAWWEPGVKSTEKTYRKGKPVGVQRTYYWYKLDGTAGIRDEILRLSSGIELTRYYTSGRKKLYARFDPDYHVLYAAS